MTRLKDWRWWVCLLLGVVLIALVRVAVTNHLSALGIFGVEFGAWLCFWLAIGIGKGASW